MAVSPSAGRVLVLGAAALLVLDGVALLGLGIWGRRPGLALAVELLERECGPAPGRDQFFQRRDAQRVLCRIVVHLAKQHDAAVRHRLHDRRRGGFDACSRGFSWCWCSVQARRHGDDESGQGEE